MIFLIMLTKATLNDTVILKNIVTINAEFLVISPVITYTILLKLLHNDDLILKKHLISFSILMGEFTHKIKMYLSFSHPQVVLKPHKLNNSFFLSSTNEDILNNTGWIPAIDIPSRKNIH